MQLWFWAAVLGGILAGVSNFCFKVAAKRGYDAELFTLYSGFTGVVVSALLFPLLAPEEIKVSLLVALTFLASFLAIATGMMKVYVLRYIDTTIYFPLFKLFGPLFAVMWGVMFFGERFSLFEWLGIVLGLTVPLLLITKVEYNRQTNLLLGLLLMLFTAFTSALTAILNKYVIDQGMSEWEAMWYMGLGVFAGTVAWLIVRHGRLVITQHVSVYTTKGLFFWAMLRSVLITLGMFFIFYAYGNGGTLGVVQTINSMYIMIPIVLAIYFYNEHWNLQKALAIVLSVVALAFFH